MRRIILFLLLLIMACGGGGGGDSGGSGSGRNAVCVAFGDSITAGEGATSRPYVTVLSEMLGRPVLNEGVGGEDTFDGLARITSVIDKHNPDCFIIYLGTNDSGFNALQDIEDNLRQMIRIAKEKGIATITIATLQPAFGDQWGWRAPFLREISAMVRGLAVAQGIICSDVENAVSWDASYFIEDGLHPNDAGHWFIANAFYNALRHLSR